MVKFRDKRS